ncbi:MAG TPA: hypothetical protein VLA42_04080 [Verrucomicrobiae bacterium]|nr:hypothetical protein [Verrucomicrobiae bacterium]
MPKWAEKAVTLMDYRVVGSRLKNAFAQNIFIVALAATAFGSLGVGCGTEAPKPSSEPAAEAKPAAPEIPEDIQDAAKHLLGSDAQVLLFGDLAKNGKRQLLSANVIPKTPQNNVPGTVVTRAIVAQDDDGKWTELLRVDEHLKNQKGYLGLTPLDSITGWRLQYEQNPEKGLQLYFTPLKVNGDTHVLTIGVRWNPATNRYQSLDASYEHFLKESSTLQNVRSSLR